jgi:excisionase family DNA binding protein
MKKINGPAKRPPAPADEIMIIASLAHYLNCHQGTVYRLLKNKRIPGFKLGGNWRFSRSVIDEWVARGGGRW